MSVVESEGLRSQLLSGSFHKEIVCQVIAGFISPNLYI